MERFFYPQRVAIIGVSGIPSNLGKFIIQNLIEFGFDGSYYAVGKKSGSVFGKPIYRSVLDVPDELDLAMILVKAEQVPLVAEECGQKGIKRLVISTAGFSEYRSEKKALENQLLEICQRYRIRFIGPNCMAVVNMQNGLFLPFTPKRKVDWQKGPVGIISQSGYWAMQSSQHLSYGKIGVSKVASIGNKLNVDEVDLLEYYLKDPQTKIIYLYLEGLSRAKDLIELACSAIKPIIIHKSNISYLSHGIARSHTSSLASDEKVVDAVFKQAGIIRVSSFEEMLNCVKVLLLPPLRGNRLVSIAQTGGASVIIADECQQNGFTLPPLPQTVYSWLQSKGRAKIITLTNPLDLGDIYDMDVFIETIEKLQGLSEIDGIFYNLAYSIGWEKSLHRSYKELFDYCSQVNSRSRIPIIIRLNSEQPAAMFELNKRLSVPFFESISGAFKAMRKVLDARQAKPLSRPTADASMDASGEIASLLKSATRQDKIFLDYEGYQILESLKIPIVKQHYLPRGEEERIGDLRFKFPVVLKAIGENLTHKIEVGGVRLDLKDQGELSDALAMMTSENRLFSARGFLIQEMIAPGIEMIVGAKRDPQFGPIVMVGLGGSLVEFVSDIILALAPIDVGMARCMVESLKGYQLLKGYRGTPPADVDSLCEILKRVSDLMVNFPAINGIDLNPVKVLGQGEGSVVIDCKIFLKSAPNLQWDIIPIQKALT